MARFSSDTPSWQQEFFRALVEPEAVLELFDTLPQVYMYVKDRNGLYVRANRVACRVMGVEDDTGVVGKSDFEFFPPAVASQYTSEDRRVIDLGERVIDRVWFVPDTNGLPQVYFCNKIPLFDPRTIWQNLHLPFLDCLA